MCGIAIIVVRGVIGILPTTQNAHTRTGSSMSQNGLNV
jgi:hypothetical protein